MFKYKITSIMLATSLLMTSQDAQALCVHNKSDSNIRAYFSRSELDGKKLIAGLIGVEAVILAGKTLGPAAIATVRTIAGDASAAPKIADVLKKISENSEALGGSVKDIVKIAGKDMPKEGDFLILPSGVLGKIGSAIAGATTHSRWGKDIKPGTYECWGKDDVVKQVKWVKHNKQEVFFTILKEEGIKTKKKKNNLYKFVKLKMIGIDKGIGIYNK